MSNDASPNGKKTKKRKASIHVTLGRALKTKLETECEHIVRNPNQQIEFLLRVYYENRDNPEFQKFFHEIKTLEVTPGNATQGDTEP